jgi:hypothetical protein
VVVADAEVVDAARDGLGGGRGLVDRHGLGCDGARHGRLAVVTLATTWAKSNKTKRSSWG